MLRLSLVILLVILQAPLIGDEVPADSLLANKDLSLAQKAAIAPIKAWQKLSYGTDGLNCQFEPSCSHFTALAIAEHGVIKGSLFGADRVLRCNPAALHYHLQAANPQFTEDGRMIDPVNITVCTAPRKNPRTAVALSIIPGMGRVYAGHGMDGILSFLFISLLGYSTVVNSEQHNDGAAILGGSLTLWLWAADGYGAWRAASLGR